MRGDRRWRGRARDRAAARAIGSRGHRSRCGGSDRNGNVIAQQRSDSRRHLLSRRQSDGADVRQRPTRTLRVLPRVRHSSPQLRQADRRDNRAGRREAAIHQGTCRGQWCRRHADAGRRRSAHALEPALRCVAALLSPSTGIIDSHAYMLALRGDAERDAAVFAFHTPLLRAKAIATRAGNRDWRRHADDARLRSADQCRRPWRSRR